MPKPAWLRKREEQPRRRFRKCIFCANKGQPCGMTNRIDGRGRLPMYQCLKFKDEVFYEDTVACEHFERPQ